MLVGGYKIALVYELQQVLMDITINYLSDKAGQTNRPTCCRIYVFLSLKIVVVITFFQSYEIVPVARNFVKIIFDGSIKKL